MALTLSWTQTARFQIARIDHDFLQSRTRIYPVKAKAVQARLINGMSAGGGSDIIQYGRLPCLIAKIFEEINGLSGLTFEADTISNAPTGNKIQTWSEVTVHRELAGAEEVHVVLHIRSLCQVSGAVIGNGIGANGRLRSTAVGNDVKPVAALLVLAGEIARLNAHVTIGFHKTFSTSQKAARWFVDVYRDVGAPPAGALNKDGARICAGGRLVPVNTHLYLLIAFDGAFGDVEPNPRVAGLGAEVKRRCAAVVHGDAALFLTERRKGLQCQGAWYWPGPLHAFHGNAHVGFPVGLVVVNHWANVRHGPVPVVITDAGFGHHVFPLTVVELVVVVFQVGVPLERLLHFLAILVGVTPTLLCVEVVASLVHVHLGDVGAGAHFMAHQLLVGVAIGFGNALVQCLGSRHECFHFGVDTLRFAVVVQAVGVFILSLGFAASVVPGVVGNQLVNFLGILWAKVTRCPALPELLGVFQIPVVRVPGHTQEKIDGVFHGLQITHVHQPDFVGLVLVGQVHLLPHFFQRHGVDPAVGARPAHVIKMVVNPSATAAVALFRCGQTPVVAKVVIGPQQDDIIGYAHSGFVKVLHLFI